MLPKLIERIHEKYFVFRYMRNLNRKIGKTQKEYLEKTTELFKAEAENDILKEPELIEVWDDLEKEISKYEEQRHDLVATAILQKANRYNIPLPEEADCWQPEGRGRFLSRKGLYEANKLIRQEIKDRREMWIPIISVLIGLIGALIGLIAVLKD